MRRIGSLLLGVAFVLLAGVVLPVATMPVVILALAVVSGWLIGSWWGVGFSLLAEPRWPMILATCGPDIPWTLLLGIGLFQILPAVVGLLLGATLRQQVWPGQWR